MWKPSRATFRFTRFEQRILWAIVIVAFLPLVGTVLFGLVAIGEAYEVGVNRRVGAQLDEELALYRTHFIALREDAERTTDAVAFRAELRDGLLRGDDHALRAELELALARYDTVARVRVRRPAHALLEVSRPERLDPSQARLVVLARALPGPASGSSVEVTVAVPAQPFADFQRAGETVEVFSRLEASKGYVSRTYLGVYVAFVVTLTLLTLVVASTIARRVTRRVGMIADATKRVGAGDLSVELVVEGQDEVGELTRAFNQMVRDMRGSRDRIEYLQRIGAWQDFARRLAHEIKNPLTPIQLAVQEAHERYEGADAGYRRTLEEARAIVEEEVATLRRLVSEFSAFAKLPEARLEEADLSDFVLDAGRSLAAVGEELQAGDDGARISVTTETQGVPLPVRIDAMMLKRCVDNLVRNAVQALLARGPGQDGRVIIAARREGAQAVLEVRDDGPGVPEADRARVFDPYFTTKADGTGLGLAIAKKVVLEHDGEISCETAPEGGAAFRMRLPLGRSE
jgi:nitrogen fixation/metabolism regulation signal transduction histidine kinase